MRYISKMLSHIEGSENRICNQKNITFCMFCNDQPLLLEMKRILILFLFNTNMVNRW